MNTNIHQLCTHPSKQFRGNNTWYCAACETYGEYAAPVVDPLDEHIENPDFNNVWAIWPKHRRGAKVSCRGLYYKTIQPGGFDSKVLIGHEMTETHKEGTPAEVFGGAQEYVKVKIESGDPLYLLETFLNKGAWEQ